MTLDEIVGKYLQLTSEAGAQACCQIMTDEAGEGDGDELYDDGGEGAASDGSTRSSKKGSKRGSKKGSKKGSKGRRLQFNQN